MIVISLHYYSHLDLSQEEQLHVDPHVIIKMGIFSPFGVSETSQDATEELNGAPIGSLGPRIQYMVRYMNTMYVYVRVLDKLIWHTIGP